MRRSSRVLAFAVGSALAATLLSGCGGGDADSGPHSYAIVVGVRANSPAPAVEGLMGPLPAAFGEKAKISVYAVDGTPSGTQILDHTIAAVGNSFDAERVTAQVKALIRQGLERADATTPEADTLGAISSAARALRSAPTADGPRTLVVADNLLSTAGALPFQNNLLSATPEDIMASIDTAEIPDLTGFDVVVLGAGETLAPQEALSEAHHKSLRAIWTLVFESAGAADVAFSTVAHANPQPTGLPPVTVVELPAPRPVVVADSCTQVLPESVVQFLPDTAEFLNPAAAQAVVAEVARSLADCPGTLEVVGTTSSWGTEDGRAAMSESRAKTVRDALAAALGVGASTITATGAGMDFPEFVDDRDAAGSLVPELAAQNRTVRISAG